MSSCHVCGGPDFKCITGRWRDCSEVTNYRDFVRSVIQVVLNRSPAFVIVIKWRIFVLLGKNKLLKNFFCWGKVVKKVLMLTLSHQVWKVFLKCLYDHAAYLEQQNGNWAEIPRMPCMESLNYFKDHYSCLSADFRALNYQRGSRLGFQLTISASWYSLWFEVEIVRDVSHDFRCANMI